MDDTELLGAVFISNEHATLQIPPCYLVVIVNMGQHTYLCSSLDMSNVSHHVDEEVKFIQVHYQNHFQEA